MTLHRFLFPSCDAEKKYLGEQLQAWKERGEKAEAELKDERRRHLKREDALVNRLLTKNNQFGIEPREVEEPVKVEEPKPQFTEEQEMAISLRCEELKANYAARGHFVADPTIRSMVEKNFDYLMDDDRVEM